VERRTFLVLGAMALALPGCTDDPEPPDRPSPTEPRADDPDAALRAQVAASEIALVAAYRQALASHPGLAEDLDPLLAHHEAHLARVAPEARIPGTDDPQPAGPDNTPAASPSRSGAPSPSPATGAPSPTESPTAAEALGRLAEAEGAAHRARIAQCDAAASSVLARDLCLIAASEAQHEVVLGGLLDSPDSP
jgi:hypothetical protein